MATLNFTKVKKAVDDIEWEKEKRNIGVKNLSEVDFEDEDNKKRFWLHKEPKWGIKKK